MARAKITRTLCLVVILFLIACSHEIRETHSLRILGIFPFNSRSHYALWNRLARGLASRGHQVDVYSHFPLKSPLNNYTDYSLTGTLPAIVNNFTYDTAELFDLRLGVAQRLLTLGNAMCELLRLPVFKTLVDQSDKNLTYDLIVVEIFTANCFLAFGRHLNVPIISIAALHFYDWMHQPLGTPNDLAAFPSLSLRAVAPMTFYQRLSNVFITKFNELSFNYHARQQDLIVKEIFGPGYPSVVDLPRDISLVLLNHHHALFGAKPFAQSVIPIGGLHVDDDVTEEFPKDLQKFLDQSHHGFVYVTFGSMVRLETFPESMLSIFYSCFKKIAPVNVLIKIVRPEDLPGGLPSNVKGFNWFPQNKVLKHKNIKAFVTHGGLMSTMESIYYGVPMVGFPLFDDQFYNLQSYAQRNMAVVLDSKALTEEVFCGAVREVLHNPVYRGSAEKASRALRDTPLSPLDTAVYWVEYVARHGRDALRSPLVDMPWWQASLLDVYAFIIFTGIVIFYVLRLVRKGSVRMIRKLCRSKLKTN